MLSGQRMIALGLAAVAAAALAGEATARGGGQGNRVRSRVDLTIEEGPVAPREARLRVRRRSLSRQIVRVDLEDAAAGFDLDVLVADGTGALVRIAPLVERRVGDYRWRVRTRRGDALPFGEADVAGLSGRALEVRTAAGALVASGAFPQIAPATVRAAKRARARSGLFVDPAVAGPVTDPNGRAGDDSPVSARIRMERKERGREEFRIQVEGLVAGLQLDAWIADAGGTLTRAGALVEDRDDGHLEYRLRRRTDKGDVLPLGVASISDLSGRAVEIRLGDGSVLAAGTVPAVGAAPGGGSSSDDDGRDDSGSDDDGDDDGDDRSGSNSGPG